MYKFITEVPDLIYTIRNMKYGLSSKECKEVVNIDALGMIRPKVIKCNINSLCPVEYYNQPHKIFANVKINYEFANCGDILLVYSGNELRGKISIGFKSIESIANGLVQSSGKRELLHFRVYNKDTNYIFEVPNLELVVDECSEIGSCESPLQIRAIGNVYIDYCKYLNYYLDCENEILNDYKPTDKEIDTCPPESPKCNFKRKCF